MTVSAIPSRLRSRVAAWLDRWGGILPLLVAEFVVWLGFGGLLPVLPLYFVEQGIDLATLGLVIAAWPAARLVSEPIFGWLADRTARVPLMVVGLLATGLFEMLPLVLTGPVAFIILRAGAGLGAAIYDPAARGYLTDATPPERRGEAFGLYGAAQMGGLLLGPTIGALGAAWFGGIGFVFIFSAISAVVAAIALATRVREDPVERRDRVARAARSRDVTEFPSESPFLERRAADDRAAESATTDASASAAPDDGLRPPRRLLNRGLIAAIVINVGGYFASGTYEVIWSLFLEDLGADLTLIGITFAMFGLPVLLFSPMAGRIVDRRGARAFIVLGCVLPAITGILYTLLVDPGLAVPLILIEATGFAFLTPALYSVVAANSPPGRSSTAQGLFGAAGTLGFIVASLFAGVLAATNILLPFYLFSAVMIVSLGIGLAIGGSRLSTRAHAPPPAPAPPTGPATGTTGPTGLPTV
ncbi:MAG TPA: MFS transporter [Candidatus Saccharimonadales bacterium]|nr:MFS transporter [Candidatus Saccharimonadales bacterium]